MGDFREHVPLVLSRIDVLIRQNLKRKVGGRVRGLVCNRQVIAKSSPENISLQYNGRGCKCYCCTSLVLLQTTIIVL